MVELKLYMENISDKIENFRKDMLKLKIIMENFIQIK